MTPKLTPSQTVGPFLEIGLPWPDGPFAAPEGAPGAITITGRVSSMSAIGPCLSSPAAYPSAWM